MINSQFFATDQRGRIHRCGYLNLKLVKGSNIKSGESRALPTQIGKELSKMAKLYPGSACAIPASFERWERDTFAFGFKPNWYLPVHLGGYGVDRQFAPSAWRISKPQRVMAAHFIHDPSMVLYRCPGVSNSAADLSRAMANWRMVPGSYVQEAGESDVTDDAWLAKLCLAARLAHPFDLPESPKNDIIRQRFLGESDSYHLLRWARQFRLRPAGLETIERYWKVRFFAFQVPACPPLSILRVPDMYFQVDFFLRTLNVSMGFRSLIAQNGGDQSLLNNSVLNKTPRDYTALPFQSEHFPVVEKRLALIALRSKTVLTERRKFVPWQVEKRNRRKGLIGMYSPSVGEVSHEIQ